MERRKTKEDLLKRWVNIVTGKEAISINRLPEFNMEGRTRGHRYKLYIIIKKLRP